MLQVNRPNSSEHEIIFEKCLYLGRRILALVGEDQPEKVKQYEIIVAEIGSEEVDEEELDRETLLLSVKITKLKNLIFQYLNEDMLERQAVSENPDGDDAELQSLSEEIKKLNSFLQEERAFAKNLQKTSLARKTAESVKIALFFFSIPVQSVIDLVAAAKRQVDSKVKNIRYINSLMTNASFIINEFMSKSRELVDKLPKNFRETAEVIRVRTTIVASDIANYVYTRKLKRVAARRPDYRKESESHALSLKRDTLLQYLQDFQRWQPTSVEQIYNSALFRLIFFGDQYYPHSGKAVDQISRDLNKLRQQPTEVLKDYFIRRVENIIDSLSDDILRIESAPRHKG